VQTRRALGIAALGAVVLAAICFAVVDVSIANANGCVGSADPCADRTIPVMAIWFAVVGTLALLVSILPAIHWFVRAVQHRSDDHDHDHDYVDEADLEVSRLSLVRRRGVEEEEA
jgi:hypothetical protein